MFKSDSKRHLIFLIINCINFVANFNVFIPVLAYFLFVVTFILIRLFLSTGKWFSFARIIVIPIHIKYHHCFVWWQHFNRVVCFKADLFLVENPGSILKMVNRYCQTVYLFQSHFQSRLCIYRHFHSKYWTTHIFHIEAITCQTKLEV